MKRIHADTDIQPLSAFRANAAAIIQKVRQDQRPVVITQHGKGSAVLLDVAEYEEMVETIELLQEATRARQELDNGQGVSHEEVMNSVRERINLNK